VAEAVVLETGLTLLALLVLVVEVVFSQLHQPQFQEKSELP
jgi:hypothetical protein